MSERDKKILTGIIPLVLIGAFWFLLLAPKRSEATKVSEELASAQQKRDDSVQKAGVLTASRDSYAQDYETVVRLGKAVPSTLDMPSLLVQLDSASKGTKIKFTSVKAGTRETATPAATPAASGSSSSGTPASGGSPTSGSDSGTPASASGGEPAQTGAGQAAEKANDASATSDQANANAGAAPTGGATGGSSSGSATPSTGSATPSTGGSSTPGLDSVPLDFAFKGSFFDLADFFHEMKRFVRTANGKIAVRGRLMTIDSLDFKPSSEGFPHIVATVSATVYLSPKSEGTNAGGTPNGPTPTAGGATATPTGSTATGSTGTGASGGSSGAPIPSTPSGGTAQ